MKQRWAVRAYVYPKGWPLALWRQWKETADSVGYPSALEPSRERRPDLDNGGSQYPRGLARVWPRAAIPLFSRGFTRRGRSGGIRLAGCSPNQADARMSAGKDISLILRERARRGRSGGIVNRRCLPRPSQMTYRSFVLPDGHRGLLSSGTKGCKNTAQGGSPRSPLLGDWPGFLSRKSRPFRYGSIGTLYRKRGDCGPP